MTTLFALILVVHGLIHLFGFFKGFSLVNLPQLTQPVSPVQGLIWFLAATLFVSTAVSLYVWPRGWWMLGAAALVLSTAVIGSAWTDAKYGMLANLVVIVGVAFGFLAQGPMSLRAAYERDVTLRASRAANPDLVSDADLAPLPVPVQRYLRLAGVVGQPRVHDFFVRMHGRIRSGPDARWISFKAEQHNFVAPRARLFYLSGTMMGIPVQGYHRFVGPSASMNVKAAAVIPVVDASGAEMDQGETVTLFNDMCVMAPATLIDPSITWQPHDDRHVGAVFSNAGRAIHAELSFNDTGELVDFTSDDRFQVSGSAAKQLRWSTPLREYRQFGPARLSASGEGRWHAPEGDFAYIEVTLDDVRYNTTK